MSLLIYLCLGWCLGIWLAAHLTLPGWTWAVLSLLVSVGLFVLRKEKGFVHKIRFLLAALVALGLGALRYQFSLPVYDEAFVATYNNTGLVVLEGVVWDEPDLRDTHTNLRLRVETLMTYDASGPVTRTVRGLVLVHVPRFSDERLAQAGDSEWQYGDRLRLTGQLEAPPEFADFSYRDYL